MKLGLIFRKIAILGSALVVTLSMLGVQSLQAQDTDALKRIKSTATLNLGYLDSVAPFSFLGPDKKPQGYSIDLCTRVASSIQKQLNVNLKLNWVLVTPENRISMVEQGKVDIECGVTTASLARQEKVDFSLMTFVDGGTLLTLAKSPLKSLSDLAGKKVGVIAGTTTEKELTAYLKEQFITVTTVHVKDHVDGRLALENGAIEAFASDQGILIGLALTSTDPKRYAIADGLFSYEPYAFMLHRNDSSFRLAVNRALAGLFRSGDILPIYDRWFGVLGKPSDAVQAVYLLNGLPE